MVEKLFMHVRLGLVIWAFGLFLYVFFAFESGELGMLISVLLISLGSLIIFGGTGPTLPKLLLLVFQYPTLLFLYYLILLTTGKL